VEVKSLQETAYDQIREVISSGEFGPGERLVEVQFAERFGMKRGSIREALCRLEHDGLVVRHTGIGVFMKDFGEESLLELCEIRAALESLAARSAASRCDEIGAIRLERQLDKLRQIAEAATQESRGTWQELLGFEEGLHHLIAEIADRPLVKKLLANQYIIRRILRGEHRVLSETIDKCVLERLVERHACLVDAIITHREEDAANVAHEHVMHALKEMSLA